MPEYRRLYVPGGTVFLTVVTYQRTPLFADPANVARLREAMATVQAESPFTFEAAVILPDHFHALWTMPPGDTAYSKRMGRIKVKFTQALRGRNALPAELSHSRAKHRESDVWQRRFIEHTIKDDDDFEQHLHYMHYNPVKHGYVACPHLWEYSVFRNGSNEKFIRGTGPAPAAARSGSHPIGKTSPNMRASSRGGAHCPNGDDRRVGTCPPIAGDIRPPATFYAATSGNN